MFLHASRFFTNKYTKVIYKYMKIAPTIGFFLTLAWITHVAANKDFYDTQNNSKFLLYLGVLVTCNIGYLTIFLPYHYYEIYAYCDGV
mmetsp:Transcript_15522/g.13563  ORF Transcript_15522/g.13563 Transcript_15522/m.13563 type:complete len:88 (+) Transcript_15522:212-475(+)